MVPRKEMTVRRVPLGSPEAGDARVGGSIDDRLALTGILSLSAWANTGRSLPAYRRQDIPVHRTTLTARGDRD
jgi:hypothetical protein